MRQSHRAAFVSLVWLGVASWPAPAHAQGDSNAGVPSGWQAIMASTVGGDATPPLRPMGPDVHLTTERSGRYFRLADTFAESATATVGFQRAPGLSGSVGLFVSTLDDAVRVEVLVRGDDQYSIRRIERGVEATSVNWTAVPAGDMRNGNPFIMFSVSDSLRVSINDGAAIVLSRGTTLAGQLRLGVVNVGSVDAHVGGFTVAKRGQAAPASVAAQPASKPNASLPAWSPDGRTIAFALRATAEGFDQIHLIDADGTHDRQLTSGADNNTGPIFSPDGKRVAYRSFHFANAPVAGAPRNMNDVSMKIMTVGRDGTDAREIATATIVGIPKWSPDSRALLFSALAGKLSDPKITFDVVDAQGTNRTSLGTSPAASLASGSWAPDSRQLILPRATERGTELRIQDRDGGHARALTSATAYQQEPVWGKPGTLIAFMGSDHAIGRNGAGQALYVVRSDGSEPRVVVRDAQHVAIVSFSPNGKRLLFQDMRGGNTDIYSIAVDGTDERRLTQEPGMDESPSWSPDGLRILFQSDRDAGGALGGGGIFIMDADGGRVKRIY